MLYNIKITIFAAEIKSDSSLWETDFYVSVTKNKEKMLKEKAGETAGKIWNVLNGTEGLTAKQIKKATKLVDKDLFLGLGWLLREDKISTQEVEGELFVKLN